MPDIISLKSAGDSSVEAAMSTRQRDQYPCGLKITLNNESLEKVGLNFDRFKVGSPFKMMCEMVVTGKSANVYEGKIEHSVGLQITGVSKPSVASEDRMKTGADLIRKMRAAK